MPLRSPQLRDNIPNAANNYSLEGFDVVGSIKKRKGGLNPNRETDLPEIKALLQQKNQGMLSPEKERAITTLNPQIAPLFGATRVDPAVDIGRGFSGDFGAATNAAVQKGDVDLATKFSRLGGGGSSKLSKVETRNAAGEPVTRFVQPSAGREVAKPFKSLSDSSVKELRDTSKLFDTVSNLTKTFKPEFGGFKLNAIGQAEIARRKAFGDDTGMVEFYQEYQGFVNGVRNKLFGGALTDTEKREFERAAIHPGMDPKIIKKNLEKQKEIALRGSRRFAKSKISDKNFNPAAVREAIGPSAGFILGGTAPTQKNRVIDFSEL